VLEDVSFGRERAREGDYEKSKNLIGEEGRGGMRRTNRAC
jgi:hypothetical protein